MQEGFSATLVGLHEVPHIVTAMSFVQNGSYNLCMAVLGQLQCKCVRACMF